MRLGHFPLTKSQEVECQNPGATSEKQVMTTGESSSARVVMMVMMHDTGWNKQTSTLIVNQQLNMWVGGRGR